MAFWWVNQNQTAEHEISGGYLWSPKRNKRGAFNQFYENMREVQVGDIVFSFYDTKIQYLGIVTHPATSDPKPEAFGTAGENWSHEGWMVKVDWTPVPDPFRPKDIIAELRPHLPVKYSPLQANGDGLQGVYLAAVPEAMARVLLREMKHFGTNALRRAAEQNLDDGLILELEDKVEQSISNNTTIDSTEKQALISARRGQGRFRHNLESIEEGCRLTGVSDRRLLRASHIKPWRSCENNHERLDGYNGLLLTPTFDHLFDQGFLSFTEDGAVLFSSRISRDQWIRLGVDPSFAGDVGSFSEEQAEYLLYHRTNIFR